jgi:uncharacterized SAM-binding protein YcdF (DUF218 family)
VKTVPPSRTRRFVARTLLVSCVVACVAGIWWWPRAGRYLVVAEPPLQPADAIVVLAGKRVERWLEGVELYREKLAPAILLSSGRIEAAESALRERNIKFPREVDLIKDAMVQLHVPADRIETFPDSVDNTAAEASVTRGIASQRGWRRLIVVTSKYHTRRSQYAFEREFRGSGVQIQVHATRFDTARPDAWWKHRTDFRYVISEYQKLLAYRLGLEG